MNIINYFLRKRYIVFLSLLGLVATAAIVIPKLSVDAVPDITNVQVVINTKTNALDPSQIEKTVTSIIENEMMGISHVTDSRSLSKYGLSQVTVIFEDGTDIYWARQQVSEKLASTTLPTGLHPELAPMTTGLGEVLMYVIHPKPGSSLSKRPAKETLLTLRQVQDRMVRPYLKTKVKGMADVDTNGGYRKEIHIDIDPDKMAKYGLSFLDLKTQLSAIGESSGGGLMSNETTQWILQSEGTLSNLEELANLPIRLEYNGQPLLLRDVAIVREDAAPRLGGATYEGEECVLGTVLMLNGANSRQVALDSDKALRNVELPEDIELTIVYSRSFLVDSTIKTVLKNLSEGIILVIAVLMLMLGNIQAAFVVMLTIPFAMVFALTAMHSQGITANLMSLGALDFGLLVDGSVVVVESILRHYTVRPIRNATDRFTAIKEAVSEVYKPVLLGMLMISLVYIPILMLEGVEGKLFKPMAITVLVALLGAILMTFLITPTLAYWVISPKRVKAHSTTAVAFLEQTYKKLLNVCMTHNRLTITAGLLVFIAALIGFSKLDSDFMPALDEGDLVFTISRDSTISLDHSLSEQKQIDRIVSALPGVKTVFSRTGTPESATDPMGPHLSDLFIILDKDHSSWPKSSTGKPLSKEAFAEMIESKIHTALPGQSIAHTQPIEMRFNEILEGSRADITLKVYGSDLLRLKDISDTLVTQLSEVPHIQVELDVLSALQKSPVMIIDWKEDQLYKYGLTKTHVHDLIETGLGGQTIGSYYDQLWRFPIVLRFDERIKDHQDHIKALQVRLPGGGFLPLRELADLRIDGQITTISHHRGKRYAGISISLDQGSLSEAIKQSQAVVESKTILPKGYKLEWGGQYQNLKRAQKRLGVLIPCILGFIWVSLFIYFGSFKNATLVFLMVPFAISGGVFSLFLSHQTFSVSAGVGFIALFGIAILNGLVLVTYFTQLKKSQSDFKHQIIATSVMRLKPVLSTALIAALGFVPMALNSGLGSEVQRPLATVVIGGIISSTALTLLLCPTFYEWIHSGKRKKQIS